MQDLRPLDAGELLDRAVTLFVRRFVPIVTVLAVITVPLLIAEALVYPGASRSFDALGQALASARDPAALQKSLSALGKSNGGSMGWVFTLASWALHLVVWSALIAVLAAAFDGVTIRLGDAYRVALRRWPAQVLTAAVFLVLGALAMIPVLFAYVAVLVVGVLIVTVAHAAAVALAVGGLGVLLVLALFGAAFGWIVMAYNLAAVAVVVENVVPSQAIALGLRRAFGPGTRWRTLVAGMVVAVVQFIGVFPLVVVGATASATLHVDALYYAIVGVGTILIEGLVAAFVVAYARDVRLRREGIDLALAIEPDSPLPA